MKRAAVMTTNKTYTVIDTPFLLPDGSKIPVGDEIQLSDDVAALHRARLRLKKSVPVKLPAKKQSDVKSDD
jgi:hypothetical protein